MYSSSCLFLLIVPYGAEIAEILTVPARGTGGLGAVGNLPLLDVRTRLTSDRKRVSNVNAMRCRGATSIASIYGGADGHDAYGCAQLLRGGPLPAGFLRAGEHTILSA